MTYIKRFHVLEEELFEKIPFKYILWYQEYLKEKIRELGTHSQAIGPNNTLEDAEDYEFLVKRTSSVFKKIVDIFETKGFSSEKFKDFRKKYRHTKYVPVISHMDCIYETAKNYRYNHRPVAAHQDISSLISSWNTAQKELKALNVQDPEPKKI